MNRIWVIAAALLISPLASAGMIYKCKNQDGALLYQEAPCAKDAQGVSSWASSNPVISSDDASGNSTLVVGQGRGGGYFVDGAVNGHYLNFAIDTGASFVTLPLSFAAAAGLQCKGISAMQTGNGTVRACNVVIENLKFGGFTLQYVDARVAPNLSQPLLGMNVLRQFKVEQDAGQMRLTRKY